MAGSAARMCRKLFLESGSSVRGGAGPVEAGVSSMEDMRASGRVSGCAQDWLV